MPSASWPPLVMITFVGAISAGSAAWWYILFRTWGPYFGLNLGAVAHVMLPTAVFFVLFTLPALAVFTALYFSIEIARRTALDGFAQDVEESYARERDIARRVGFKKIATVALCTFLVGVGIGEVVTLSEEREFKRYVALHTPTMKPGDAISWQRAWPNENCSMHYSKERGFWSKD